MSDETGIQETEPAVTTEQATTDGPSYHDRIRSEPDFAVTEVQGKDRYIGELHETALKYKGMEQYVDAVGGDELVRLARIGQQIETSPQNKEINDLMRNVPPIHAATDPEEPELYDPEIKAVRDRFDPEIAELKKANEDLQTRLSKSEALGFKGALSENFEAALVKFKDDPVLFEKAQTEITRAVNSLHEAAARGDRSAASQLEQLGSAQGARTLRMMTIDIYEELVEKRLEGNVNQPDGEVMLSKATDARTVTRSALPTDTIAIKSGVKVTPQMTQDVMEKVAQKMGKDPNVLFGH